MNDSLDTSEQEAAAYTPPARNPIAINDPDAILRRIQQEVGRRHCYWDQVDPHELIRAVLKHAPGGHAVEQMVADVRPAAQHPDDAAVDRFAVAMKEKLAAAREKGRDGWQTCPIEGLQESLVRHVVKGDPRDVADFCMMLWVRGERTVVEDQWVYDLFGVWPAKAVAASGESVRGEIAQVKQQPFAYFKFEPSKGMWSQMMPGAAGQPGVIPAYANPQPEVVAEQFIQAAIDSAPEPLRRLGEYLASILVEDQWATTERMLLAIANGQPIVSVPSTPIQIGGI